jgi:hypothetical protein
MIALRTAEAKDWYQSLPQLQSETNKSTQNEEIRMNTAGFESIEKEEYSCWVCFLVHPMCA